MKDLWRVFAGMHFEKFFTIDLLGGKERKKKKKKKKKKKQEEEEASTTLKGSSLSPNELHLHDGQKWAQQHVFQAKSLASENAPGYIQRNVWRQCPENYTDFDIARLA